MIENGLNVVLSQSERELIFMHYGFGDYEEHSFKEIGELWGISRSAVQQRHKKIIRKLQKELSYLNQ